MNAQLVYWLLLHTDWSLEEWKLVTSWAGWTIFLIVEVPMLFLLLAAIFGRPKKPKVTFVFITTLLILFTGFVVTTWVLGRILSMAVR